MKFESLQSVNREHVGTDPLHEYRKRKVRDGIERIRSEMDNRRDEVLGYIQQWEALAQNDLTLPRHREEYLTHVAEARDFVERFDKQSERFEQIPEIKEVETDEVIFRLVFERHDQEHSPKVLEGLDAYAFEGCKPFVADEPSFYVIDTLKGGPFSSEKDAPVCAILRESELPLYSCDVSGQVLNRIADEELFAAGTAQSGSGLALSVLGALLLGDLIDTKIYEYWTKTEKSRTRPESGISRRQFLGIAGKAMAGVALFGFGSGLLGEYQQIKHETLSSDSVYGRFLKAKESLLVALGMKEVTIRLRNAVMAQQLHGVAKQMSGEISSDVKPHIGMELGSAHFGIEDCLRMSETKRVALIRDIMETLKISLESPDKELATFFRYEYLKPAERWYVECFVDPAISEAFGDYPYRKEPSTSTAASSVSG
ncbi:MAG: hypothetical protein HGB34_04225 [Candidatus Moranbacteria bacterium]|nr:hypothetical protein [Candidatus Moranbacteria bacterium]